MAYLVRKGSGWLVRWREGGRGAPVQSSELLPLKADAMRRKAMVEQQLAARHPIAAGRVLPWDELIRRWGTYLQEAGRSQHYADESPATMQRIVTDWPPLNQLTRAHLAPLGKHNLRIAKACLGWARRSLDQPVPDILDTRMATAPTKRPPRPLVSPEQIATWIAEADKWSPADGTLAHLIATYGHRAQSLVGLTCAAFDLKASTITLPVKGGDTIRHPLLPATVDRVRPLIAGRPADAPAFIGHRGVPWPSGRAFASWWHHSVAKGSGYYDLKRYAITTMFDGGADAVTIASITGHRTPSLLLNTYARTNEARQLAAINALVRTECARKETQGNRAKLRKRRRTA